MRSGSSRKYLLLTALYLAQGLPYGFFTQALPALLREMQVSRPMIGASYLLTLPWALKFLWAPLVDRYAFPGIGLRRSWILPLQALATLFLIALGLFDPRIALPVVLFGFLLLNLCAAGQDIATDGWAVDLLNYRERGVANGIQVAGYRLGMIVGGGLMLVVFARSGWTLTMWSMAALVALTTIPVFLAKEPETKRPLSKARLADAFEFVWRPGAFYWIVVLLLYKSAHAFATGMLRPFLIDHGFALSDIAQLLGAVGFTGGLLGAIAGGWLAGSARDRRKLLVLLGIVQFTTVALYPLLATQVPGFSVTAEAGIGFGAYVVCALEHFTSGMATATLFTVMMDASRRDHAATDYTFQASLVVIATGVAGAFSGISAESLGYNGHFLLAAALGAAFIAAIFTLVRSTRLAPLFSAEDAPRPEGIAP